MKRNRIGVWICIFIIGLFLQPWEQVSAKTVIEPTQASGTAVEENEMCVIDYSHADLGYVMIKYKQSFSKTIKVQVFAGKSTDSYKYNIKPGRYEVIPLTEGNTTYKITVNTQTEGNSYLVIMSKTIQVKLKNQFVPYIRPNQYVNYNKKTKVVKKAAKITKKSKTELAKVKKVYKYVISQYKYDHKLAKTVKMIICQIWIRSTKRKKGSVLIMRLS